MPADQANVSNRKKSARRSKRKQQDDARLQCIHLGSPQHLRLSGPYTVEMWVKMDEEAAGASNTTSMRTMKTKRRGNGSQILFMQGANLALFLYNGVLQARLPNVSNSAFAMQSPVDASMLTSWTHIALVGDATSSTMCVPLPSHWLGCAVGQPQQLRSSPAF